MPESVDSKKVKGPRKADRDRSSTRSIANTSRTGSPTSSASSSIQANGSTSVPSKQLNEVDASNRSSKRSIRTKSKNGKNRRSHSLTDRTSSSASTFKSPTPRKPKVVPPSTGRTPEEAFDDFELFYGSASSVTVPKSFKESADGESSKNNKEDSKRAAKSGKSRRKKSKDKASSRALSPGLVPHTVSGQRRRFIGTRDLNNRTRSPGAPGSRSMITNHQKPRHSRRKSSVESSSEKMVSASSSSHVGQPQSHSTLICHNPDEPSEASDIESEDEKEGGAMESMSSAESVQDLDSKWQQHMNRTDNILFSVFPRHIAEALVAGKKVEPENHELVTIFFSDIVGFTDISSTLDPLKISDMLDRLYHSFDALSSYHEVFKVETIGDAYMAVTNLAKKQSDHCKRIAEFSIDAIRVAQKTPIDKDDLSKGYVNIRVGFHSGPVVSNVVGSKNPRYCLFGDTVNTSSRMESNSAKNLIHCSDASAQLLQEQAPTIRLFPRGTINVKGKGAMNTYWVHKEGERESVSKSFFKAIRGKR